MEFENKVAVITGAASGIGRSTAKLFAREGAKIAVVDINLEGAEAVCADIRAAGGEARAYKTDVTLYAEVERCVTAVAADFGHIDMLVCCAGGAIQRIMKERVPFYEMKPETLEYGLKLNLLGPMFFARAVSPYMVAQKSGKVIVMGSVAGVVGTGGSPDYSAEKGGLISFTKGLALALARYNINVNCVSPGPVLTRPEMANLPTYLGRAAQPEEISDLIMYLCSEKASFITAQNYIIDGGRCWGPKGEQG